MSECPGRAEYGHGFSRTTVHAGCCPPCNCVQTCGDADDEEGTCKGLRRAPEPPLVEIVLVPRRAASGEGEA